MGVNKNTMMPTEKKDADGNVIHLGDIIIIGNSLYQVCIDKKKEKPYGYQIHPCISEITIEWNKCRIVKGLKYVGI